jgi:opacity protein-like surface antigen
MRPSCAARAALVAALYTLAFAPLLARAQPISGGSGPATYFELHAGAVVPQHDDLDAFGTGFSVGGTFGARFTRYLSIEGELAYWQTNVSEGGMDERIAVLPLTASLRVRLPVSFAELSAFGGAGLHVAWYTARAEVTVPPVDVSENDAVFGYHVGAAIAFQLSPTILAGAEVRRTFVTADFAGTDVKLDGLRIALTLAYQF